ncbi:MULTISPECIES: SemiSWEET family sugar transporter [Ensifer]|uniref:SemiSWEET family sugar transporter n=1 Tax=Ensifer TaxID=106591 RepID=UPI0009EBD51B
MAAVANTVCWLPQAIRTIRTKRTASLSLWSNVLLLLAVTLWCIYGLGIGAVPV